MISKLILAIFYIYLTPTTNAYYDDYFLPNQAIPKNTDGSHKKMTLSEYDDSDNQSPEFEQRPTGFTCGLCVVVDEEFSQAYNIKDETALKSSLEKMVDHSSWIFRTQDWNNDGRPDNIGFKTNRISYGWRPYKHETPEHYETPKVALELLKIFARLNFSSCCLGVGFTNRPFLNGQDGVSFAASDRLLGGICDHRNPHEDFMASTNIALISGRGLNASQLTSYQVGKALVHELGHSFGVHSHDNEYKDKKCWGYRPEENIQSSNHRPSDGRYIMWAKSFQAHPSQRKNSLRFSFCSKAAVAGVVNKRKNRQKCFDLDYNPFCGNGIIEGVEMCDCGNEYDCSQQKCCGSRKSDKPCMILDAKACPANIGMNITELRSSSGSTSPSRFLSCVFIITTIISASFFQI